MTYNKLHIDNEVHAVETLGYTKQRKREMRKRKKSNGRKNSVRKHQTKTTITDQNTGTISNN